MSTSPLAGLLRLRPHRVPAVPATRAPELEPAAPSRRADLGGRLGEATQGQPSRPRYVWLIGDWRPVSPAELFRAVLEAAALMVALALWSKFL